MHVDFPIDSLSALLLPGVVDSLLVGCCFPHSKNGCIENNTICVISGTTHKMLNEHLVVICNLTTRCH